MILSTAAILIGVGALFWVLGTFFDYTGIAVIGAVIVLGVGVAATTDGLYHQTGVIETVNSTTNTTITEFQYERVEISNRFPLGMLILLLGGVGALHPLAEADDGGTF